MKLVTIYPYNVKQISVEKPGRKRVLTLILHNGKRFVLRGVVIDRFLQLLNTDFKTVMKFDILKREQLLLEKMRKRKHGVKLQLDDDGKVVINVFSALFSPIPHGVIIKAVNDFFKEKNIETTRKYWLNQEFYGRWIIENTSFVDRVQLSSVRVMLWVFNRNDGKTAMRIGLGYYDYICDNGAMGWREAEKLRLIHKVRDEEIYAVVRNAVARVFKGVPGVKARIIRAHDYEVTYREGVAFIKSMRMPRYIEDIIKNRWASSSPSFNLWLLSSAISFAARLDSVPVSRKLFLMREAYDVLDPGYFTRRVSNNGEREDNNNNI